MDRKRLVRIITVAAAVLAVATAMYIMARGLGLSDRFDFGVRNPAEG